MRKAAAVFALLGCTTGLSEEYVRRNGALLWEQFKATHGKAYSPAEEARRYGIFMQNMVEAAELEKANPKASFGASKFADLTKEEFKAWHSLKMTKKAGPKPMFSGEEVRAALADSVDWRAKGAVTQVKDQGQCGSCWAFSSTGGIEGANFLAGNKLTSVSEQELVSCDKVDQGCNGGLMDQAYSWLVSSQAGAIVTEAAYPYTSGGGSSGRCESLGGMAVGSTISGHKDIAHDESQMAAYVAASGPLPIGVDAQSHWQTYTGGVVSSCSGTSLDHGVLIVGYTSDYWIVKNSWGSTWGESGYIRLAFGTNQCGLTQQPTAPLVSGGPPPAPHPPTPPTPVPPAASYAIHALRWKALGCHGDLDDNETHTANTCWAVNASAPERGFRLWQCGPCREGTCLSEYTYDDKDCTQISPSPIVPNPEVVPAEKCEEQAIRNHFHIHCEGSG